MSLFEFLYIGHTVGNNRRGLRLPLLLGRLHLGLIFSGPCSNSTGRKSTTEKCSLRSFLFIATVLITKCGSNTFPRGIENINKSTYVVDGTIKFSSPPSTTSSTQEDMIPLSALTSKELRNLRNNADHDYQDSPIQHILSMQAKEHGYEKINGHYIGEYDQAENVKTLGYVLKGMILPMLISLTLSFGFIIYKNRLKRARLQAIQNALEAARLNPNQLIHPHPNGGIVSNALLSVLDARGEWSLISGSEGGPLILEGDDYVGEGGETARHKPYLQDKPPDYASVVDPPTYEQATASVPSCSTVSVNTSTVKTNLKVPSVSVVDNCVGRMENEQLMPPVFSTGYCMEGSEYNEEDAEEESENDEGVHLIGTAVDFTSLFD